MFWPSVHFNFVLHWRCKNVKRFVRPCYKINTCVHMHCSLRLADFVAVLGRTLHCTPLYIVGHLNQLSNMYHFSWREYRYYLGHEKFDVWTGPYWPSWSQHGWILAKVLFIRIFMNQVRCKSQLSKNTKKNKAIIQPSWPHKHGQFTICTPPIIHLVCPRKFCTSILFNFFGDHWNTQGRSKPRLCKSLGGKVYYGEMCKWRIKDLRQKENFFLWDQGSKSWVSKISHLSTAFWVFQHTLRI